MNSSSTPKSRNKVKSSSTAMSPVNHVKRKHDKVVQKQTKKKKTRHAAAATTTTTTTPSLQPGTSSNNKKTTSAKHPIVISIDDSASSCAGSDDVIIVPSSSSSSSSCSDVIVISDSDSQDKRRKKVTPNSKPTKYSPNPNELITIIDDDDDDDDNDIITITIVSPAKTKPVEIVAATNIVKHDVSFLPPQSKFPSPKKQIGVGDDVPTTVTSALASTQTTVDVINSSSASSHLPPPPPPPPPMPEPLDRRTSNRIKTRPPPPPPPELLDTKKRKTPIITQSHSSKDTNFSIFGSARCYDVDLIASSASHSSIIQHYSKFYLDVNDNYTDIISPGTCVVFVSDAYVNKVSTLPSKDAQAYFWQNARELAYLGMVVDVYSNNKGLHVKVMWFYRMMDLTASLARQVTENKNEYMKTRVVLSNHVDSNPASSILCAWPVLFQTHDIIPPSIQSQQSLRDPFVCMHYYHARDQKILLASSDTVPDKLFIDHHTIVSQVVTAMASNFEVLNGPEAHGMQQPSSSSSSPPTTNNMTSGGGDSSIIDLRNNFSTKRMSLYHRTTNDNGTTPAHFLTHNAAAVTPSLLSFDFLNPDTWTLATIGWNW